MAVKKNQEYTVTIEGYSGEVAGVVRIDGLSSLCPARCAARCAAFLF